MLTGVTSVVISGPGVINGTGDLKAGETVSLTVTFDASVNVSVGGNDPYLLLNNGSKAVLSSSLPGPSLTFGHFIIPGEDVADLAVTALNLNGATIKSGGVDVDVSGATTNPAGTLTIDTTNPTVVGLSLVGASQQFAGTTLQYAVAFSEDVTGVDPSEFSLTSAGVVGASIVSVTPGGDAAHYTVNVNSGSGAGTIGLNVLGTNIRDLAGNSLDGLTFATQQTSTVGNNPISVALGDVNGDGKPDLVVVNSPDSTVSVLLGNGDGTFATQHTFNTGAQPFSVKLGDVNGDHKLDIVVANRSHNNIGVLLGNGDGTFGTQQTFATGSFPIAVVLGDVNGDGKPDLVASNSSDNTVSVLLGNGDGTFATQHTFGTGNTPYTPSIGDVNGDGKPDLVVANLRSDTISVLLGNGDGTFAPQQTFATGHYPMSVALGDVNGDGKLDAVTANFKVHTVSVLLGNGNGTFAAAQSTPTGAYPDSVTIGDVNGDGTPDLIVTDEVSQTAGVLLGTGTGTFAPEQAFALGNRPFSGIAGDLNGDGKLDLIAVNYNDNTVSALLNETPRPVYTLVAVGHAPTGTSTTVTTLEDTNYVFATADFGFSDPDDNPANALSTVMITTLPASGVLTDNGVAVTAGQFVSAADIASGKLVFAPAANANGPGNASFTFQVQDNGPGTNGNANLDPIPKTMTVDVTSVNDAPSGAAGTVTVLEDQDYVVKTSDFGFTDPSDTPANQLLAVKFEIVSAYGTFTDNGVTVTNNQVVSAADISQGKLVFRAAANLSGGPYFFAKFQVQDDGGTANGGVDLDPTGRVLTFQATAVNDAPRGTSGTVNTLEDQGYVLKTSDFGFSDPNDHPANPLLAVKFDIVSAYGTLTDNGVAVTANQFVSALDIANGKLVFTSSANLNGGPYFLAKFQVQDNGGTANGGIDLDPNGQVLTFKAASVNDAPKGTSGTVTTVNDQGYVLKTTDFGFTDPNDSPANQLLAVKFDIVSAYGTLTDNGVAVTANQFVSALDISHGKLIFIPSANVYGGPYFLAKFQVQDNGGTAHGGVDLDPNGQVLTFNSLRVNHAPVGTSGTVTMPTNNVYVLKTSDFGFTDPNDNPANQLLAVKVDIVSAYGTLTDNGVVVTANQSISAEDISSGKVAFTSSLTNEGGTFFLVKFQVQDNGGTANDGADLDPTGKVLNFKINKANHAPTGTSGNVTTREDQGYVLKTSDFGFSDPNDNPANNFKAVRFVLLSAYGTLTDNGVAVTLDQTVSVSDISLGKLVFTPTAGLNGGPYFLAKFQVQDDGGEVNGGLDYDQDPKVLRYIATSVDDAPVGASKTITTYQNLPRILSADDFGFTDPNDQPSNHFQAVKITTLPTAGSLTDNGVPVTAGQYISFADLHASKLVFTPATDALGSPYGSFTFQVQDDGGTANGGIDLDITPRTFTINVLTPLPIGPLTTVYSAANGRMQPLIQDTQNDWFWT